MTTVSAEALLDAHGAALRSFLGARCRDADVAADLVQETSVRLLTAEARLSSDRNARGYLFQIAANVWRDHLRRELARRRASQRAALEAPESSDPADAAVLAADLGSAVRRAIAALPAPQREVLELRQRDGLKFREIADRLRRPLGTVLGQMRAALDKIHVALEEYR